MAVAIRRRQVITLLGGATIAWPLAAWAQQPNRLRKIGVLNPFAESDPEVQANLAAFRQALQGLGWTDGRTVRFDHRWGDAMPDRIRAQASDLVRLNPDVILVSSALALQPLLQQTRSIPIVFTQIADPVGAGFVASLSRPGGNLTGFTVAEFSTFGKLPEVLKGVAPNVARVAVILQPDQIPQAGMLRAIESAAPSLGVQVTAAGVRNSADVEQAINEFAREPNGGLVVLPNPVTEGNRGLIVAMAIRRRLPTVSTFRSVATAGGLVSYGSDQVEQFRQAAGYVDRILRGEKPADLPVQNPSKFELVINLKTAKALGLTVPPSLLSIADEVIE